MFVSPKGRAFLGFNPTGDLGPFTIYSSRRHGTVWFIKAPPLKPPSIRQLRQRARFKLAAEAWRALPATKRANWSTAATRARLYLGGYQLWIHWQLKRDRPTIETIERLTNLSLL